jgi:anti-sigma-K factor RskA
MNTTQYIASGILEEYTMGLVSPQERQEVECMSHIYPELRAELDKLEQTMEAYAKLHAKTPTPALKQRIFENLTFAQNEETPEAEPMVIKSEVRVISLWRPMAIAASVALVAGLGWAFYQNNQNALKYSNLTAKFEQLDQLHQTQDALVALYQNPQNKVVNLNGVPTSANSLVVAFWNKETKEVSLNIKSLPVHTAAEQYQLWAIVDGKPVDMGVIEDKAIVTKIRFNQSAAAFAITLEKRGGSPVPTLEKMVVVGNV